ASKLSFSTQAVLDDATLALLVKRGLVPFPKTFSDTLLATQVGARMLSLGSGSGDVGTNSYRAFSFFSDFQGNCARVMDAWVQTSAWEGRFKWIDPSQGATPRGTGVCAPLLPQFFHNAGLNRRVVYEEYYKSRIAYNSFVFGPGANRLSFESIQNPGQCM